MSDTDPLTPNPHLPRRKQESNPGSAALQVDALTSRPTRRYDDDGGNCVAVANSGGGIGQGDYKPHTTAKWGEGGGV